MESKMGMIRVFTDPRSRADRAIVAARVLCGSSTLRSHAIAIAMIEGIHEAGDCLGIPTA